MSHYFIAEINIAKMKGVDINDPIKKEFLLMTNNYHKCICLEKY